MAGNLSWAETAWGWLLDIMEEMQLQGANQELIELLKAYVFILTLITIGETPKPEKWREELENAVMKLFMVTWPK